MDRKKLVVTLGLCSTVLVSSYLSLGATLNDYIDMLSAGISPNTTGALPNGGFPISRVTPATSFDGVNQIGCANGAWGNLVFPPASHGSKCLIQYNAEDNSSAHAVFLVAKNIVGVDYPFI